MTASVAQERRVPCPRCGAMILIGARKCRGCKRWLEMTPDPRGQQIGRILVTVLLIVVGATATWLGNRESPVGDAPPLTPLPAGSSEAVAALAQADAVPVPAAIGPDAEEEAEPPLQDALSAAWTTRRIRLDVHPLDVVFSADGRSVYVSCDDASLREYDIKSGRLLHMATIPAQGDRIRLLHDRYIAIIRLVEAAHIPVLDTEAWEKDPMLLWVGQNPADIVGLPDGRTVVTASSRGKRLTSYDLVTGRRIGDIRLPHETRQLYLLQDGDRPLIGALGTMRRGGNPVGAWMDLFDPAEEPFGATRRSIAVGRTPQEGAVTRDRAALLFVDNVANSATTLSVDASTKLRTVTVGQSPIAGFLMAEDRYGVTLDSLNQTATVVDMQAAERTSTLMLNGSPNAGATSQDGSILFVSLGGAEWPPTGRGAAIIAGDPPQVVVHLKTGRGASRVAAARDGSRAVVLSYRDTALNVIERK